MAIGAVQVWTLDPTFRMPAQGWRSVTSDAEIQRAGGFARPEEGALYLATHALLRAVLARAVGRHPVALDFDRSCVRCGHPGHGRPRLRGGPSFSVSRTRGLAVVAVGDVALGVDVEAAADRVVLAGLHRVWSAEELAHIGLAGPAATGAEARSLLRRWAAKEAVGKARGSGLIGLADLTIEAGPAGTWRDVDDGPDRWVVEELDLPEGFLGALASAGPSTIRVRRATELHLG